MDAARRRLPACGAGRAFSGLPGIDRAVAEQVKAYAHDLKDWFTYLGRHGLNWRSVGLEDVAGFVAWLRLPPTGRDGLVSVLPTVEHHRTASSVNRKLAALTSFCEFHARHGARLAGLLVTLAPADGAWQVVGEAVQAVVAPHLQEIA